MLPDHQIRGYTVFRQAQMVLVVEGNHLYILFVWSFLPVICNGNPGILFTPGLSSWGDGTSLTADYRYLGVPPHKLTRGLHHWFHVNILAWRAAQQQGLEWHHGIATPLPEAYGPMGWTGLDRNHCVADPLAGIAPYVPSGERLHSNGKSPCLMGKSTISMAMFNSFLYVHQAGYLAEHKY